VGGGEGGREREEKEEGQGPEAFRHSRGGRGHHGDVSIAPAGIPRVARSHLVPPAQAHLGYACGAPPRAVHRSRWAGGRVCK